MQHCSAQVPYVTGLAVFYQCFTSVLPLFYHCFRSVSELLVFWKSLLVLHEGGVAVGQGLGGVSRGSEGVLRRGGVRKEEGGCFRLCLRFLHIDLRRFAEECGGGGREGRGGGGSRGGVVIHALGLCGGRIATWRGKGVGDERISNNYLLSTATATAQKLKIAW